MAVQIDRKEDPAHSFKDGRTFTIMDKFRSTEKVVFVWSLQDLIQQGRDLIGYGQEEEVWVVLEEDGTEVDEDEYLELLPERTALMLLSRDQLWSPTLTTHGSCFFENGESLPASYLASALINHLKANVRVQSNYGGNIEEDDFPVLFVQEEGVSQLKLN